MIWLTFIGFLISAMVAAGVVRWARDHARHYGEGMPQRFHLGHVPRLGGLAVLLGVGGSWLLGAAQSVWGDPGSLRLGAGFVLWWLAVLLPAALGGIAEDMTQRLRVSYRLFLTGLSGSVAVWGLGLTLPRLGLPWLDALLAFAPWIGVGIVPHAAVGDSRVDGAAFGGVVAPVGSAPGI